MEVQKHTSDSNMLFGILALQMDFISREQLIEAMSAWVMEKSKPIGQILLDKGALNDDRLAVLNSLISAHLAAHDDDIQKSLASVSSIGSVREELETLADQDVSKSLASVSRACRDDDPYQTRPSPPPPTVTQGTRFQILRFHGKGGIGKVLVAYDNELNREVAMKELQPRFADDQEIRARFLAEAKITGGLEHPGIVPVYGLGQYADGRPYYAMRFIHGDSFLDAIRRYHSDQSSDREGKTLALRDLLGRLVDACNAIAYAHSRGVTHRDLKPGNIMLGKYGETLVLDWGMAKAGHGKEPSRPLGESTLQLAAPDGRPQTQHGAVFGTLQYMSPEQASGQTDRLGVASDVYSLGATLYSILTGRPPFTGTDPEVVLPQVRRGEFPRPRQVNPAVPRPLEAICLKAMARSQADRHPSPRDLADDLERWMADEPVSAYRESLAERFGRWIRRHRSRALQALFALVLVVIVSVTAAIVVNRARRLAETTRDFDVALLKTSSIHQEQFLRLERLLKEIDSRSAEDAEVRRSQLHDRFLRETARLLEVPRFADSADERDFDQRLGFISSRDDLSSEDKDRIEELSQEGDSRRAAWDELFDLRMPFDKRLWEIFDPQAVELVDGARMNRLAAHGDPYDTVLTSEASAASHVKLSATFDRSWTTAAVVGLALDCSDEHRYEFLITVPQFDPRDTLPDDLARLPSAADVTSKRTRPRLRMQILRDGEQLRVKPVALTADRLRLTCERDGSALAFYVNDRHSIRFVDPFPIPVSETGLFGVYWPKGVSLESVQAGRRRVPRQPSPLERGDQLFAGERYADALDAYAQYDSPEAKFKQGLCFWKMHSEEEAVALFEEVAEGRPDPDRPEQSQWWLLAVIRLAQRRAASHDRPGLETLVDDLMAYFKFEDIARLLPAEDRARVLQHIRRAGQRFRIAYQREGDVEDLQRAVEIDAALNEDDAQRRMTQWRLADVYRVSGRRRDAIQTVTDLVRGPLSPGIGDRQRTALVSDLVWMWRLEGEEDKARDLIREYLGPEDNPSPGHLPLLIDLARIYYSRKDLGQAESVLDTFLNTVERRPDRRPASHGDYAMACAIRGLLYEDQGEQRKAQQTWLKGTRRRWHEGPIDPRGFSAMLGLEAIDANASLTYDSLLASLTNDLTKDEAVRMAENHIPGSGLSSRTIERLVFSAFPPEFLRDLQVRLYQTPRGRDFARRYMLRELSLRASFVEPLYLILYTGVFLGAYPDLAIEAIPEDEEQLVYSNCCKIVEEFDAGRITDANMIDIMEIWRGNFSRKSWDRLAKDLHPERAAGAALVLGKRSVVQGKPERGKFLLQYAAQSEALPEPGRRRARSVLAQLEAGPDAAGDEASPGVSDVP